MSACIPLGPKSCRLYLLRGFHETSCTFTQHLVPICSFSYNQDGAVSVKRMLNYQVTRVSPSSLRTVKPMKARVSSALECRRGLLMGNAS